MAQKVQTFYIESVSGRTVQLETPLNFPPSNAGVGIAGVTLTTVESTAEPGFYGTTGTTCGVLFRVTIERL